MRYLATIIDGALAAPGSCCDMVHLDDDGHLIDPPALWRLVLKTSIGERFVDLCAQHDDAVGSDLARWSHPLGSAQRDVEGGIDAHVTDVLRLAS